MVGGTVINADVQERCGTTDEINRRLAAPTGRRAIMGGGVAMCRRRLGQRT